MSVRTGGFNTQAYIENLRRSRNEWRFIAVVELFVGLAIALAVFS